jgi:hypothetical protein
MRVLIVGADRLGNIPEKLYKEGVQEIIHWDGRKKSFFNKDIPKNIDSVILFCDFLNHRMMYNIKRQAKAVNIPIVFKKRSLTHKAVVML